MRIGSFFIGDDFAWGLLTLRGGGTDDTIGTCRLLVEKSSVEVGIARIFLLYLLVKEIDQILILLTIVLFDWGLSWLSWLS